MKSFVYVFNVKLFWWCLQFLENEGNENFLDLVPKHRRVQTSYIWKKNIKSWNLSVQVNIGILNFWGLQQNFEISGGSRHLKWLSNLYSLNLLHLPLLVEAYVEFFYYSDRGVQFRWNIFCLCCFSMWNTYKYLWRKLIMKSNLCSDYHIAFSFLSTFLHILIAWSIFHVFLEYIPYPVFLGIEN